VPRLGLLNAYGYQKDKAEKELDDFIGTLDKP
jgi:hypothetical protein